MQIIDYREEMLRNLNNFVIEGASLKLGKEELLEREDQLKEKVRQLNEITDNLLNRVREMIGGRKLFGYAFVYDGLDYCKVVMTEMRQLKSILLIHGIDMTFAGDSYSSQ
jgi:hypothetical protein